MGHLRSVRGHRHQDSFDDWDVYLKGSKTVDYALSCVGRNKRGTKSGHYYQASMNWETGRYTYGYKD